MLLGTPQAVSSTLLKCWTIAPTSERIIEDISAFPRVLGKIVAAEGCVVKDEFLRTGRRARRADGNGLLKNKPRASQRKATLKAAPLHPDCQAAYDAFVKGAQFDVVSSDAESSSEEEEEEGGVMKHLLADVRALSRGILRQPLVVGYVCGRSPACACKPS